MSFDLTVLSNARQLQQKLNKLQKQAIPKAASIAAERAMKSAALDIAKTGQESLDDPIQAVFHGKKARNRLGWIYWEWPDRAEIKRKKGEVEAFVQLQGQGNALSRSEQQEALHRQIYGTKETRGVTPAVPYIIRPSRRLRREKSIKGLPFFKIDKFGNLRNHAGNMKKAANDPRFFHIPLGKRGGGIHNNGIPLPPGLYFRQMRKRTYKRNKHTKRRGGPYGDGGKKQFTKKLITVFTYHYIRDYKAKWDFKPTAVKKMQRTYKKEFLIELNRAILKAKPLSPSGNRLTGNPFG